LASQLKVPVEAVVVVVVEVVALDELPDEVEGVEEPDDDDEEEAGALVVVTAGAVVLVLTVEEGDGVLLVVALGVAVVGVGRMPVSDPAARKRRVESSLDPSPAVGTAVLGAGVFVVGCGVVADGSLVVGCGVVVFFVEDGDGCGVGVGVLVVVASADPASTVPAPDPVVSVVSVESWLPTVTSESLEPSVLLSLVVDPLADDVVLVSVFSSAWTLLDVGIEYWNAHVTGPNDDVDELELDDVVVVDVAGVNAVVEVEVGDVVDGATVVVVAVVVLEAVVVLGVDVTGVLVAGSGVVAVVMVAAVVVVANADTESADGIATESSPTAITLSSARAATQAASSRNVLRVARMLRSKVFCGRGEQPPACGYAVYKTEVVFETEW
jgi:hypothetical protein